MGKFLNAAYRVLSEIKNPLSPEEIVAVAIQKGYLTTEGKTPSQTMKSKLSTDILESKSNSRFMRSASGLFTLREYAGRLEEHVAPRHKKALFDEEIVVFSSSSLPRYISKPGLRTEGVNTRDLLAECFPMQRRAAEETFTVIQLVSFYVVTFNGKYLTYKRTKRLPESRLHGYYSIAFGGHLNPDDIPSLFNHSAPDAALTFIIRELREELLLPKEPTIAFKGLLYDDSRDVSKQHIGLVYDVRLEASDYKIGERGFLMDPKFESISEIMNRIGEFENWSALVARHYSTTH